MSSAGRLVENRSPVIGSAFMMCFGSCGGLSRWVKLGRCGRLRAALELPAPLWQLMEGYGETVVVGAELVRRIDVSILVSISSQMGPLHSWSVTTTSGTSWYSCSIRIS